MWNFIIKIGLILGAAWLGTEVLEAISRKA